MSANNSQHDFPIHAIFALFDNEVLRGGGDFHLKKTEVLVVNFEKNVWKALKCCCYMHGLRFFNPKEVQYPKWHRKRSLCRPLDANINTLWETKAAFVNPRGYDEHPRHVCMGAPTPGEFLKGDSNHFGGNFCIKIFLVQLPTQQSQNTSWKCLLPFSKWQMQKCVHLFLGKPWKNTDRQKSYVSSHCKVDSFRAVSRKVVSQKRKSKRDNVEVQIVEQRINSEV